MDPSGVAEHCQGANGQLGALGDPLPAHSILINPGSAYFSAQAERWTEQPIPGAKPQLRVPLDREEDLPHALAAIRFIYSGQLEGVCGAEHLLHVRRLASYLQVEGCMEACGQALLELLSGQGGSVPPGAGTGLAGLSELFACRHLLPGDDDDPGAEALLAGVYRACREQLVRHFESGDAAAVGAAGQGDSTGDILGWAFRDAPTLLSDPALKRQMQSLPAAAMEALLGSATFATDNEASVLLMLAEWLRSNPGTSLDVRSRLCRLIRLSQLSHAYLYGILPKLQWFSLLPQDHPLLCQYATADAETRGALAAEMKRHGIGASLDSASVWFSAPARPRACADVGTVYEWSTPPEALAAFQAAVRRSGPADAVLQAGEGLVANGFIWKPMIRYNQGKASLCVALHCDVPEALAVSDAARVVCMATPGAIRLAVYSWQEDGSRVEAHSRSYQNEHTYVGKTRSRALPRLPSNEAGANADALAPWGAYIHEGKISGCIVRDPLV